VSQFYLTPPDAREGTMEAWRLNFPWISKKSMVSRGLSGSTGTETPPLPVKNPVYASDFLLLFFIHHLHFISLHMRSIKSVYTPRTEFTLNTPSHEIKSVYTPRTEFISGLFNENICNQGTCP